MMKHIFIILVSLLIPEIATAQEKQLYRVKNDDLPIKGYLLGPNTGGTPTENFESCEGTRTYVDASQLERERGTCLGENPGTLIQASDKLKGVLVYDLRQQPLGTIENAVVSADGSVEALEITNVSTGYVAAVAPKDVDLQQTPDGRVQAIYVGTSLKQQ